MEELKHIHTIDEELSDRKRSEVEAESGAIRDTQIGC
jgi:hypothetical protein